MTQTYAQVMKQIETLSREAEKLKRKEVDEVIAKIKKAIDAYGLTASDLGLAARKPRAKAVRRKGAGRKIRAKTAAAVKFRDEAGNTWVGRGPRPQWLRDALAAGKRLEDFVV